MPEDSFTDRYAVLIERLFQARIYLKNRISTKPAEYILEVPEGQGKTQASIVEGGVVKFEASDKNTYDAQMLQEDFEYILPPSPVELDHLTKNNIDGYNIVSGEISEYEDWELEPLRPVDGLREDQLYLAEVDRISHSGNPVIELEETTEILDRGNPGEQYLVKDPGKQPWVAISKAIE